jgi:UDP-glucose 4-epimerase
MPSSTILVTGGAGYIGSHTCLVLLAAGYDVVVVDTLINSDRDALRRVEAIAGRRIDFHAVDVRDRSALRTVFARRPITAVIHFAGLKAVGESVQQPLSYMDANVGGSIALLEVMAEHGCTQLVFSSSATVYGDPEAVPIPESARLQATNPYGRTKLMIEDICRDLVRAQPAWRIALLRYFNPVGAHPSGRIGEDPQGIPNNLVPYLLQVAIGRRPFLSIYGNDYPTPDGTGVRDYLHVMDLADGHVAALRALPDLAGAQAINLGTGVGHSVMTVVTTLGDIIGRPIPTRIVPRRAGDIATCYADAGLAQRRLGWRATRTLKQMLEDAWRWQQANPNGYRPAAASA